MHIVSALIPPPSLNIFFFDSMLHFSSLSSWFLVSTIIRVQPWKSLCKKEVWARGLKDWWPCPFPHLLLISVLMWSKLYCFAHRQATPPSPGHPSLSLSVRHTSLPWGALLKCQGPSRVRPQCPLDLCLLNSKLWCIKAQRTTNGFACIKHLCCFLIKGPFTTGL